MFKPDIPPETSLERTGPISGLPLEDATEQSLAADRPDLLWVPKLEDEDFWTPGEDEKLHPDEAIAEVEKAHRFLSKVGVSGAVYGVGALAIVGAVTIGTTGTKYVPYVHPKNPVPHSQETLPTGVPTSHADITATTLPPIEAHTVDLPRPEVVPTIVGPISTETIVPLQLPEVSPSTVETTQPSERESLPPVVISSSSEPPRDAPSESSSPEPSPSASASLPPPGE